VIGVLVLTTGFVALLAYQALDAARLHVDVAERALGEHAAFAAWEFSSTMRRDLSSKALKDGLELAARSGAKDLSEPLESLEFADSLASAWEWPDRGSWGYVFRIDLAKSTLTSVGNHPPSVPEAQWLVDSLPTRARAAYDQNWGIGAIVWPQASGGVGRTLVYRFYPKAGPNAEILYGFRGDMAAWHAVFENTVDFADMLPPSLTQGKDTEDLMSLSVSMPEGEVLFSSTPSYDSPYSAVDTVGSGFAGLIVKVVMHGDVAETLLIGGLPRSRIPELVTLLLLTLGLIGAAIVQLRRENELAQLRIDFVSGVSHELRTPLAQIRMFAETLALGRIRNEDERKRSLNIIVKEAQRLAHQVDNVLLFSKSERRAVELNLCDVDLSALLLGFRDSFGPVAEAAGARLRVSIPDGVSARVDTVAFPQAIYNLLDNAVKYGPPDQTINLTLAPQADRIRIIVDDEGPGVPEDDRDRIWDAYHRLGRDRDSAVTGSGIGLAVVKEVVSHHGGRVWATKGPSGGRFIVELPRTEQVDDAAHGLPASARKVAG
jgi:signal transduction histidine kinase